MSSSSRLLDGAAELLGGAGAADAGCFVSAMIHYCLFKAFFAPQIGAARRELVVAGLLLVRPWIRLFGVEVPRVTTGPCSKFIRAQNKDLASGNGQVAYENLKQVAS